MSEKEYADFLRERKHDDESIVSAVGYVREFEEHLAGARKKLEHVDVDDVKKYVSELIEEGKNTENRLLALARYTYMAGPKDVYIYFTSIIGGRTVLPSISERLASIAGEETRDKIFEGVEAPPLGSPPEEFPRVTKLLMKRLRELGPDACHNVLAGNHHRIPVESFQKHRQWLREAGDIDAFLRKVHEEAVDELERYMAEGRLWYEQEITPEVVEFVRGNQEVLSAVREGDYLYITKIPYAPRDWLRETDPDMKRYYACHCPLARAAITMGEPNIPLDWCYCSGGYEKLMFDVVFEEETEVDVLESALAGDPRCRFRVKIPEGKLHI